MTNTCHHGNLMLPASEPWPGGQTPYCSRCWKAAGGVRTSAPRVAVAEPLSPRRVKIDPAGLIVQPNGGRAFNGSLIRFDDRWLLAYRTGWKGSRIAVCECDPTTGTHGPSTPLALRHPLGRVGYEDPRLFAWRGRLHVAYTAYDGRRTHQLYAKLSDDLRVEREFAPDYPRRAAWEKNWQFFEGRDAELYAVYSISPHVVLRIDGERCDTAYETACPITWDAGHMRGGCPPVFVDGEWWHWFHGAKDGKPNRRYSVGLYTFAAEPPFEIARHLRRPVAWASEEDWQASGNYCRVVFPGGAVLGGDRWHVAVGVHDRWLEVWSWEHAKLKATCGHPEFRGKCRGMV